MATTASRPSSDAAEIRELVRQWSAALEAKDVGRMMSSYAPDAVLYDAIPPYKVEGADNIRQVWESCLPHFPEKFRSEHRDLSIHVSGDLAVLHGLHHFVPEPADDPFGQTWMRITVAYRRIASEWKVIHEHVSIPFNPMNKQAWFIRDPDVLDMPDYGSAGV